MFAPEIAQLGTTQLGDPSPCLAQPREMTSTATPKTNDVFCLETGFHVAQASLKCRGDRSPLPQVYDAGVELGSSQTLVQRRSHRAPAQATCFALLCEEGSHSEFELSLLTDEMTT